jgi:hypothetical protein
MESISLHESPPYDANINGLSVHSLMVTSASIACYSENWCSTASQRHSPEDFVVYILGLLFCVMRNYNIVTKLFNPLEINLNLSILTIACPLIGPVLEFDYFNNRNCNITFSGHQKSYILWPFSV